jgi:hypothetical protein
VDPDKQIMETDESNNLKEFSFTTSSQSAPPTLTLTPASGPAGTVVSASGFNYQGTVCTLTSQPSGLFVSQTCTITAGSLTGSFAVDTSALANTYTVGLETDTGSTDFAIATFTVTPSMYTITFYTDPASGTIAADGISKTNGLTGAYAPGARVHVVAIPPSGYSFVDWTVSGVSVDNPSVSDTYMNISGSGSLKARFGLPQFTVKSKSTLGAEFSGAKITVDKKYYVTPFSLALQGKHSFTAPSSVTVSGVSYKFARWEDELGNTLSAGTLLSYTVESSNTLFAVYNPPQYSVTVYGYDATTRKALSGASVYLDGNLVGTTSSRGYLVVKGVYAGLHTFTIRMSGYLDYTTTITVSRSTTLKAYVTHTS